MGGQGIGDVNGLSHYSMNMIIEEMILNVVVVVAVRNEEGEEEEDEWRKRFLRFLFVLLSRVHQR